MRFISHFSLIHLLSPPPPPPPLPPRPLSSFSSFPTLSSPSVRPSFPFPFCSHSSPLPPPPTPPICFQSASPTSFLHIHILSLLLPQIIAKLVDLLEKFSGWVDEIPPIEQPQRFGNKAFREWSKRLKDVRMLPQTVSVSFQVLSSSRNVAITCTI